MYPEYSGATLLGELVGKHLNLEEKMSWETGSGEMVRAQKSREQENGTKVLIYSTNYICITGI